MSAFHHRSIHDLSLDGQLEREGNRWEEPIEVLIYVAEAQQSDLDLIFAGCHSGKVLGQVCVFVAWKAAH